MNYRMILRIIGYILRIEAALMLPAVVISYAHGETAAALGFWVAMGAMLLLSAIPLFLKPKRRTLYARDGFVVVGATWVVVSLLGALPFYVSGAIPRYVDCLFETISGFTTTGASILSDVEALPYGLLYWRSFTHWLGGMGVMVFLLAVMPLSTGAGDTLHILRAESPGPRVDKLVPRTAQTAKILYYIYFALTVVQCVFLLAGGMPVFDAVTTSFATAGTGGFAIKNTSMGAYSPYLQTVVTVFMALFGVNFGLFYLMILREWRKALLDEELLTYLGVMLLSSALICVNARGSFGGNLQTSFHHAAFQVSSIMTTTGFATVDFNAWPEFSRALLVVLMLSGACAGSTGGGIKWARVLILFKSLRIETHRLLQPRTVRYVRYNGQALGNDVPRGVGAYLMAYCLIAIVSTLLVALDGFPLETNLTGVLACLNNIGPGLGLVGPTGNFGAFSDGSKVVLMLNMLIGRLEIFPMLVLFFPRV